MASGQGDEPRRVSEENIAETEEGEHRRKRSYSPRPCPHCGNATLIRRRLKFYLRPFRKIGIDLGAYSCATCHHNFTIRRDH